MVPYDRMEYASVDGDGWQLTTRWVRATYQPLLLDVGFQFRRTTPPQDAAPSDPAPFIDYDMAALAEARPPGHPTRLLAAEGIRTGLGCPLAVKGRLVGYLFFASREEGAYDDFHLWAMSRIAGVVAGAVATGQLRDELARQNRRLEEAARFRSDYLAAISHELRTPLAGVAGLAAHLIDQLDELSPAEIRDLVGTIFSEAADAASIVEDLLVLGRAEAGHLNVTRQPTELAGSAREVAAGLGVLVEVVGEATAVADPARVRQVLRNLLANAVRYGGERIWVEVECGGSVCRVRVCDDGDAIPTDLRERIFEAHQRSSVEHTGDGAGLGLWVSRELAERMGGALTYDHAAQGSRFTLTLPTA